MLATDTTPVAVEATEQVAVEDIEEFVTVEVTCKIEALLEVEGAEEQLVVEVVVADEEALCSRLCRLWKVVYLSFHC